MLPKQQQTNSNIINQSSSSSSMTAIKSTQKCAQLQIPGQESSTTSTSTSKRISPSPSSSSFIIMNDNNYNDGDGNNNQMIKQTKSGSMIDIKDFFDDNYNQDKLKCYTQIIDSYRWFRMKSFSTTDILMTTMNNGGGGQIWSDNQQQPWCSSPMINNNNNINNNRKYLSDCNLNDYYRFINMNDKQCIKDYITYSCSTLAICGDTIHSSSQLPSPSQAQSFRQLNSTSLIFSDIDLAKSMNRKILNDAIKQRLNEFIKVLGNTMNETLTENELINIDEISSDIVMKPIKMMINNDFPMEEYTTGDILINVVNYEQQNDIKSFTKKDKEKFVLNWLQTVETTTGIMEPN